MNESPASDVILSEAKGPGTPAMASFASLRMTFSTPDTSPHYLPATISRTRSAVSGEKNFRIV